MMKLEQLLNNLSGYQIKGCSDLLIRGLSSNSKKISSGYLFIVKQGKTFNGREFIKEAVEAGASAIVIDQFDPTYQNIVQIIHPDVHSIESILASTFYQEPSQEMLMIGITGTCGKTTISYVVKRLLDDFFPKCGLIGTIQYFVGENLYQATHTTPDVITNHHLLREMVKNDCQCAVMEVTSHALDQGRVDKIDFDVAVFSNLTPEHLDYHSSMESYAETKKRLFSQLGKEYGKKQKLKWAIVNQDSIYSSCMLAECSANIISYGIENDADVKASQIVFENEGTRAKVTYRGETLNCFWPLIGRFNVYNCLAAIAVCLSQNIPLIAIAERMRQINSAPGRLQAVKNSLGLKIYVDFAHKEDALINVLKTLKSTQSDGERLIVVFGCGGDRDLFKRPKMAKACELFADYTFVTSDNPRSEDPYKICEEIIGGFTKSGIYQVEIDRKMAIQKAIKEARKNDIILIAGKGHETYQIFSDKKIEFDDSKIARDICQQFERTHF